jgi:6-phosphogluconolactonase
MALAAHPFQPVVYVANGVKMYRHEPRGTVEAFRVNPKNGRLELLARQPLSLSATEPRSLAVAPDGQNLLVAAFGGGVYNVLPIDSSGAPDAPSTILKQVGRCSQTAEQAVAHPRAVLFHPREGWAIGTDFGADRLDFLSSQTPRFAVSHRLHFEPESGPSAVALDPEGRLAVTMQRLRPALMSFRITACGDFVALGSVPLDSVPTAIEFHREQSIVYCGIQGDSRRSRLEAWRIDSSRGGLEKLAVLSIPAADIRAIHCGRNLLALASECGLMTVALHAESAAPQGVALAAGIPGVSSLAAVLGS